MWTRYLNFVPPVMCDECGENAALIRRTPNVDNPIAELRIFQCPAGHESSRVVDFSITDAEVQDLAERLTGRGPRKLDKPIGK
jgi:hypothetical protein